MKDFKRLLGLLGPYKKNLAAAMLLVLIETSLELVIPTLAADLIDNGIATGDVRHMLLVGGGMALCALIALITGLTYARHAAKAAYGWGARIREAEWAAVQRWSFSNMDHYETSSLVTRMTSDVTVMQNAINGGLRPLTRAPIMFLLGTFFSFTMNAKLALIFIIMTPLLGLVLFLIVSHVAPMYTKLQATVDNLNSVVEEDVDVDRPRRIAAAARRPFERLGRMIAAQLPLDLLHGVEHLPRREVGRDLERLVREVRRRGKAPRLALVAVRTAQHRAHALVDEPLHRLERAFHVSLISSCQ